MDAAPADSADWLPLYHFTKNGSHVILQAGSFECVAPLRRAIVVNATGGAWVGCWSDDGDHFSITWEDKDTLEIPKGAIRVPSQPTPSTSGPKSGDRSRGDIES